MSAARLSLDEVAIPSSSADRIIYLRFWGQQDYRAVAVASVSEFRRGDVSWGEWRVYLGGCPAAEEPACWSMEPFAAEDLPPGVRLVLEWGTKVSEVVAQHMFPGLEFRHPLVTARYAL